MLSVGTPLGRVDHAARKLSPIFKLRPLENFLLTYVSLLLFHAKDHFRWTDWRGPGRARRGRAARKQTARHSSGGDEGLAEDAYEGMTGELTEQR